MSKNLQALYIYLGTATLIGALTGTVLFAIFSFLSSALNIDVATPRAKRRTPAGFRADFKVEHQEKAERPAPVLEKPLPRRRGLLSQTIDGEGSDF